jgi:hypothetical protein
MEGGTKKMQKILFSNLITYYNKLGDSIINFLTRYAFSKLEIEIEIVIKVRLQHWHKQINKQTTKNTGGTKWKGVPKKCKKYFFQTW